MKYLYLKGRREPIMLEDDKAQIIGSLIKENKKGVVQLSDGTIIDIASIRYLSGQVREDNDNDAYLQRIKEYQEEREKVNQLNPQEKAVNCSWGHFKLFYWIITGKQAPLAWKDRVREKAAEFYAANPNWIKPSVKLWMSLLKEKAIIPNREIESLCRSQGLAILERAEEEEFKANYWQAPLL